MGSLPFRVVLAWFAILLIAIISGGVRDKFVRPTLGNFAAEVFGAAVLSAACFVAAFFVMRAAGAQWHATALRVGTAWLLLTVVFEFGFFHYIGGHSWRELLAAYRIWEGRLWSLVLLSTFVAPFVAGWLRARN